MKISTIAEYRKVIALQIIKKLVPFGSITKRHSKKILCFQEFQKII